MSILPSRQYKTVIFVDLDDTIIEGPFETVVFPRVFNKISQATGLDLKTVRKIVVSENMSRQKDPNIPATLSMDWDDIFRTVARKFGLDWDIDASTIIKDYSTPPYSHIIDDAKSVLEEIRSPDRAIIASTKGLRKYQIPILEGLGLISIFTDILTPDKDDCLKSNVCFYGEWPKAALLQIAVGDHYIDDVIFPASFGFKTVWKLNNLASELRSIDPFNRPFHASYPTNQPVYPNAIIVSLPELPSVIYELEKQFH